MTILTTTLKGKSMEKIKSTLLGVMLNAKVYAAGGFVSWYVFMVNSHGWHPGHPVF